MLNRSIVVVCALSCAPVAVRGANIEYRVIELTGQTTASNVDPIMDFAIQGRVSGGTAPTGLGSWYFDSIQLVGDAESRATFNRDRITNSDGTYFTGAPVTNSAVGQGGVAGQYSFLATVSAGFNGLINTSGGTFTNTADNEIGNISGYVGGTGLLNVPGVDANMDGRPDSILAPATTGQLPPAVMPTYFGQGQFIDIYRFRLTFNDLTVRSVLLRLNSPRGQSFTDVSLGTDGSLWGAVLASGDTVSATTFNIQVVPAPAAGIGLAVGSACVFGRRRRR
jgi:hypothetical protein